MATSVTSTANSSRFHARSARVIGIENTCICWLVELHKSTSENHAESVSHLQQIANSVKIFNDLDELVDFATEIHDQKLFTIIPMVFIENIVSLHDILQIDSIYILNEENIGLEKSIRQHTKFKGIYTNMIDICEHLKYRANQAEQSLVSISIFSSDTLDLNTPTHPKKTNVSIHLRDTFVYRMLNHALRISEVEVLIYMAFFIKDLHQQITLLKNL